MIPVSHTDKAWKYERILALKPMDKNLIPIAYKPIGRITHKNRVTGEEAMN